MKFISMLDNLSGQILPEDENNNQNKNKPEQGKIGDKNKINFSNPIFLAFLAGLAGLVLGAGSVFFIFKSKIISSGAVSNGESQNITQKLAAESADKFQINLKSDPKDASIYLDNSPLSSRTPADLSDISNGSHLLQIVLNNKKWEANLDVESEKLKSIEAIFSESESIQENKEDAAAVFLSSAPAGASVFVNGEDINKITPVQIADLEQGSYKISVKLNKYADWQEEVLLKRGDKIEIKALLSEQIAEVSEDGSINKGWRKYENNLWGLKAEFPFGWKEYELSKPEFDLIFSSRKDGAEYKDSEQVIVFSPVEGSEIPEPIISISIVIKNKNIVISELSQQGYKIASLDADIDISGMDFFEAEKEKAAVIKKANNPYVFIISFLGDSWSQESDFAGFINAFSVQKPSL